MSASLRGLRAYRALLRLFPRGFRRRRQGEMERLFGDMCAERLEERGRLGAGFWAGVVWDTGRGAWAEWASRLAAVVRSGAAAPLGETMGAVLGDARFALRQMARQPLYAVLITLLMAAGIAGNAAVFRVFNGLFLKPLPFESPEQLVDLDETAPTWDLEFLSIAYRDFAAWREGNRTFHSMAVFDGGGGNLVADGSAQRVSYLLTTHDMDDVLGLQPVIGRFYGPVEDAPDGPRVALLSLGFWEQEFGGNRAVLGQTVSVSGVDAEVIGVLPHEARFVADADMWMPLRQDGSEWFGWGLNGVGRMSDGVTIEQARADLMAIHKGLIDQWDVNEISSPVVSSLRDRYLGDYRLGSGFLLGAVGIVLLIACANIAGLMTVRSITRGPELAIRKAMGAPRGRILRQLLTESLVLGLVGGVAGAVLGVWGSGLLVEPMAEQFPRWISFDLDARFLAFVVAATLGAALVFGLTPALHASGRAVVDGASTRSTGSFARRRGMSLLVAGEVALALALLVVGGLTMLDVFRLGRVDPGFEPQGLISYRVALPSARYEDGAARLAFTDAYLERLASLPGIESAAVASALPLSDHWGWFFQAEGAPPRGAGEANPVVLHRVVSPGYFGTLRIPVVAGRGFDSYDGREEGSQAIIVNETFVRTHLSHLADPVGARVTPGTDEPDEDATWMTVVGVTRDVRHYGVDEEMRPGVYQPLRQFPLAGFQLALRTSGETEAVLSAVRATTADLDVELPVYDVRTMEQELDESLWTRRAISWLIGVFSCVALLMAVAGVYGVISYSVRERTREISIRKAVGARQTQILRDVVGHGMLLVGAGAAVGLLLAVLGAELVSGILVGVEATTPSVYVGVTGVVLAVALVANYMPARRAAAMDPMKALRGE